MTVYVEIYRNCIGATKSYPNMMMALEDLFPFFENGNIHIHSIKEICDGHMSLLFPVFLPIYTWYEYDEVNTDLLHEIGECIDNKFSWRRINRFIRSKFKPVIKSAEPGVSPEKASKVAHKTIYGVKMKTSSYLAWVIHNFHTLEECVAFLLKTENPNIVIVWIKEHSLPKDENEKPSTKHIYGLKKTDSESLYTKLKRWEGQGYSHSDMAKYILQGKTESPADEKKKSEKEEMRKFHHERLLDILGDIKNSVIISYSEGLEMGSKNVVTIEYFSARRMEAEKKRGKKPSWFETIGRESACDYCTEPTSDTCEDCRK